MIVDRLLFLWVEKGTERADDDIECGATEAANRQTPLPLQPHSEDDVLKE